MPRNPDGLTIGAGPVSMMGSDSSGVALDRLYSIKRPLPRPEAAPAEPRGISEEDDDTLADIVKPARAPR